MARGWGQLKELPELGAKPKRIRKPEQGRQIKAGPAGGASALNYAEIKREVLAVVARLPDTLRWQIPQSGTLPEIMAALGLAQAGMMFRSQQSLGGGRQYAGGSVVDLLVQMGGGKIAVRVQGDYWHSLPERKYKDQVQFDRLHAQKYRVADVWEKDIYDAWGMNQLRVFMERAVLAAV